MATKQEQERAGTEVTEVAPGILRMQLPIDMPGLGHVNCYALVDERGVALVDPGVPGPETWTALEDRLKQADLSVPQVHTVIVTHSHPDHFGTAGRLTVETGADLVTHSSFDTWFTRMEERPTTTAWGGEMNFPESRWREHVHTEWVPPVPTVRVEDQGSLTLGGRRFVGVHTPGHTKDHLCLHDPENGILLSGDHVLPTITPHISGAFGDAVDPLADFFASLEKVAKLNVSRVLPAHGNPFDDLAGRTKAIHEHHLERLDRLVAAAEAAGSATVEELSHELFRERHWGFMAESETYAHLEHLRMLGRAERFEDGKGLTRYRVA